ncbi:MAG TPA: uroporphyrinogen decarboxylase family protein [Syntrophorhabdaceae bacterium]|nr:uroporphyrinogen decarboxylase family protein [Syntrophorhabdaceae bacterium]
MDNVSVASTAEEKRAHRLEEWLNPQVEFVSPKAATSYKERAQRMIDALSVKEPDRVPVFTGVIGSMPAYEYGLDYRTVSYDYDKLTRTWDRFNEDHAVDLDSFFLPATILPSKVLDLIGYRLYNWPGHGLPNNARGFQYVEGEYMKATEYDAFLRDPSDFWLRGYLPRISTMFEAFRMLKPLTHIVELPMTDFASLALPDVQASLQALIDAGKEYAKYAQMTRPLVFKAMGSGYPLVSSTYCKAPFDTLGDTLRGTKGIMMDMYRHPDKVLAAVDRIADLTIETTIRSAEKTKSIIIVFPLHKGADGWMSQKQFETFYWPTLKKVIDALNNEGFIVQLFAEGKFDSRLDSVNEFRKGFVTWRFDQTDMAHAKAVLGGNCCIWGNLSTSLLVTGTPEQVKKRCHELIEICAPGGGYILCSGASADEIKLENLKAMIEAAREYGVYRK